MGQKSMNLEKPKTLADYGVSVVPQSFVYVSGNA
jgi:hypothetical protein